VGYKRNFYGTYWTFLVLGHMDMWPPYQFICSGTYLQLTKLFNTLNISYLLKKEDDII